MNWKRICFGFSMACLSAATRRGLAQRAFDPGAIATGTPATVSSGGFGGSFGDAPFLPDTPVHGHWDITYLHRGQANLIKSNSDSHSDPLQTPIGYFNTDPYSYLSIAPVIWNPVLFSGPVFSLTDIALVEAEVFLQNDVTTGSLAYNDKTVADTTVTKSINLNVSQFITTVRFTWRPDNGDPNNKPPSQIQCIVRVYGAEEIDIENEDSLPTLPVGVTASLAAVLTCAGVNFPSLHSAQYGDVTNDLPNESNVIKKYVTVPTAGLTVVDYPIDTIINLRANCGGPSIHNPANNPVPDLEVSASVYFDINVDTSGLALTSPYSAIFPAAGMTGNQYIFNTARPGVLNNPIWTAQLFGETKPASAYIGATTFDSFTINGSARGQTNITAFGSTLNQKFNYTGLPKNNSDFGNKQVSVRVAGDVNQSDQANVQVFFNSFASNWPGTDKKTPNWFHYYGQVYPPPPNTIYDPTLPNTLNGQTDPNTNPPYQIQIGSACEFIASQSLPCFALRNDVDTNKMVITLVGRLQITGIHNYIATCAHELGHRQNMQAGIELNHDKGVVTPDDTDGDCVSDTWERNHCLKVGLSDTAGWYTGTDNAWRGDAESLCQIVGLGALVKNYGLFSQDWADKGIQYALGMTPDNQRIVWIYTQVDKTGQDIPGTAVYNQPLPAEILTALP